MNIKLIQIKKIINKNGLISVIETNSKTCPFDIKRIFNVYASKGDIRGDHAHKTCIQMLICTSGKVEINCIDGNKKSTFVLDNPFKALLLKPMVWAKQKYLANKSILTVICDQMYDEKDYIRNFEEYITLKKEIKI